MKGFIYILEITIALTIVLTIFMAISSFSPGTSMERSILIESGDNALRLLKPSDVYSISQGNTSRLEEILPKSVRFGVKVEGVPKSNITVGCVQPTMCGYISGLLANYRINNRSVNFTVAQIDISSLNYIPQYLDAVVFVNYTDYSTRKNNITSYLRNGGVVVGINGTYSNINSDFNDIFGLTAATASSGYLGFAAYSPQSDEIEKYFLGTGFDIKTDVVAGSRKNGYWYIWEAQRLVSASSTSVNIQNKTVSEGLILNVPEGGYFNLLNPYDSKFYTFKVRKIFWDNSVSIVPMNTSMTFRDITEPSDVTAKTPILVTSTGRAGMGSNNTAVWISDFPRSDEFFSLVRSAIVSRVKDYDPVYIDYSKKYATVSSFYPLCCDMPETAKLTLYLWYRV